MVASKRRDPAFWGVQAPKCTQWHRASNFLLGHNPRSGEHISRLVGEISSLEGHGPEMPHVVPGLFS